MISPGETATSCYLEQLGTCRAPCQVRKQESYRRHCQLIAANRAEAEQKAVTSLLEKVEDLADRQEYEQAAVIREQLAALLRAGCERELLSPLLAAEKLIFALPAPRGGWVYLALAYGKIVGTAFTGANAPKIAIEKTVATLAEVFPVTAPRFLAQGILWEQLHILAQQLYQPGTRIVQIADSTALVCPVSGMLSHTRLRQKLAEARKPFSFRH